MESFFLTVSQIDSIELKELLIRRYHSLDFIKDMELMEFLQFINLARKKENEDKLWQQWCGMLPQFSKYTTFNEFKDSMSGANIDMRKTDVIIKEIEDIHRKKEEGNGS